MDPTVAALLGALIGGLLSAASSLLAQRVQSRSQWLSQEMQRRQQLYSEFIDAATSAYADALEHDEPDAPMLSRVYAEIGRMRLHSSNEVIREAYALVHQILAAYRGANRTALEIRELLAQDAVDIYSAFGDACRAELVQLQPHPIIKGRLDFRPIPKPAPSR